MNFTQKPLTEQVILLTGATSGIGLVTARMAAENGARLMLVARNENALASLTAQLADTGHDVSFKVADVANEDELDHAAERCIDKFGRIDTWINNAGVSIYGRLEEVSNEDSRRLFETNFWGVVNGSLIAAKHFKNAGGGTLINIGSTLSDRAIPIQGMYCASKHAVKGFTDALRMELEAEQAPVIVTLVKPAAIDTPYKEHAKNYLEVKPQNPPPVYAPETVAEAILHCCENPVRDVFIGAGGKAISAMGNYAPRITDYVMEATMIDQQKTDEPAGANALESLHAPGDDSLTERGGYEGHVAESSIYTRASLHPVAVGALAAGLGAAAYAIGKGLTSVRSAEGPADPDNVSGYPKAGTRT